MAGDFVVSPGALHSASSVLIAGGGAKLRDEGDEVCLHRAFGTGDNHTGANLLYTTPTLEKAGAACSLSIDGFSRYYTCCVPQSW